MDWPNSIFYRDAWGYT